MNAPKRIISSVLLALSIAMPAQTPVVAAPASQLSPTITSDLADYPPGATVTLTGAGWQTGESVHIFVNDDIGQSWNLNSNPDPIADGAGMFIYSFQLPNWFVANYSVIAGPGSLGSGTATTTFTDANVGTYDQCANDDNSVPPGTGYTTGDTGCQWINGNLQSNTAYYAEGDATVQRVWLTGFTPGLHTLTLQYGTTKGGKHAYDFLTTWDWSEDWIVEADRCQGITGCVDAAGTENRLDIPQDPNVPDSFEPSAPGDRQFVMRGATLQSATTPVIESGSYAGDSETIITISFLVPSTGPMCTSNGVCDVALWFGAHVSAQANWGLGQGAGSINGSPYHVALYRVDGAAIGQRDNQMQSNVVSQIPNGTIVVVKDAVPNSAQDFSFNLNNGGTINQNFSLDDDADATLPNSQTFSVPPGTWSVSELNIPSGWALSTLTCSVAGSNGSTFQVSGATATIVLKSGTTSGDTVTCTYVDTRNTGSLQILKNLSNPDGATVPATYAVNYDCGNGLTGQVNIGVGSPATVNDIPTGSVCTVTEVAPAAIPGYTWGTVTYSPASVTINDSGTFAITVGNSISRDKGSLKVSKTLNDGGSGFSGNFSINYDCGNGLNGTLTVAPGGFATVNNIPAGSICTVTELTLPAAPTGYSWGTPTISGSPATIVKDATVEVTVGNSLTRDTGSLVLAKSLTGGPSSYTGPFTIVYDCDGTAYDGSVQVNAGSSQTISGIPTGTSCTMSEPTLPSVPGYTFGTPTFSPADTVVIPAGNGSSIQVTTNNTLTRDTGSLKILKTLSNPDGATVPSSFTVDYDCGTGYTGSVSVAPGSPATVNGIPTGNVCSVTEVAPAAIPGYTWGTVTYTPASVEISTKGGTFEITVGNSITRDRGSLKILKTLSNPDGAAVPSSFTVDYDCGTGYTGSVSVASGSPATVNGIPTGSICTVTEVAPAAIPGYTWGTVTYTPASVEISTKGGTFEITVGNSISRDRGSLKVSKLLYNPEGASVPSTFAVEYVCDDGSSGTINVAPGGSATVNGIPTGSICTVTEVAPAAISGFTWGAISYTDNQAPTDDGQVTITAKNSTYEVIVGNSITRDRGMLKIEKTLSNPDGAAVQSSFTVNFNCGLDTDGTALTGSRTVAPGSSALVGDIPTGNTCSVTEVAPVAIPGYTWGTVTYTPSSVVIGSKDTQFTITVANSITRDRGSLTIVKKVVNDNGGTATVSAFGLNTSADSLTFDSGTANGTTTTYTSQKITVVTGNYTLKENNVYGYTEGTWSCTGAAGTVVPTYNNGSVDVGKDEDVVCTIINNDDPGKIVVIKNAMPAQGNFAFTTTGSGYNSFNLTGAKPTNVNTQTLSAGTYTVKETTQLGWALTGIGGSTDPNTPYNCVVAGSGGSTGVGDLNTQTATISLKNGDTVTCTFENTGNGATRTQGFWSTHPQLAQIAWDGGTKYGHTFPGVVVTTGIGDKLICGRAVDSEMLAGQNELMGGFWSDIAKKSDGKKRTSLDQARMQLLQQLLAAELNASAFGSVPPGGTAKFNEWENALCGTNETAIKNAQQQAASFNSQGDSSTFTPGTSADSKNARLYANIPFWNIIKP